ncbi:hypothetical protein [Merismopedia glauca]|uniref:Uncharacterized protein n=1 Tax=Merismopedia glauca CCAP 1448/3 TaxID=1296344 RepID=A0A2T1C1R4_9CYAN|nr:hypothetical protein [Merismopedia glauca]PSB02225.1 hypothetical protein C7B64_14205 [Merismopedia glauca CCAP 1448/3]
MFDTFTEYLHLSPAQTEKLLSLNLTDLLDSPAVLQKLSELNTELLRETLPTAGSILASHLPPFYEWLKTELKIERVPDSPDHTTRWVINFLNNRESLIKLVELHRSVPSPALERAIPRLVGLFDSLEDTTTRREWQTAISALCLVLAVAAREQTLSVAATH